MWKKIKWVPVECQLINIEGMMEFKKSHTDTNNCFFNKLKNNLLKKITYTKEKKNHYLTAVTLITEWLMDGKMSGWIWMRNRIFTWQSMFLQDINYKEKSSEFRVEKLSDAVLTK